jgi:hypothetical protein
MGERPTRAMWYPRGSESVLDGSGTDPGKREVSPGTDCLSAIPLFTFETYAYPFAHGF